MKHLALYIASCTALACMIAFAEEVSWPTDFESSLADHIEAEASTNTTSGASSILAVEPTVRTVALFDFAVKRSPPPKLGVIIIFK